MASGAAVVPNVVVAADGSGNYTTISDAVAHAPRNSPNRYVIHIKAGFYKEYVVIGKDISNLTLARDGVDKTVISGNRSVADHYQTYYSGTVSKYTHASLRYIYIHI
jgi:pectinesterase